ncbi:hypothetical protein COLO4_18148 [Corchorus olitorius]|uniref:Uncharacterized protein n=1 Tax=Corchorus olitorius TaxID=93759 RepID=A0A1R3JAA2_9ROSI|nr:hypothetical protein COLO4_18148 [Corchorus olitorius]
MGVAKKRPRGGNRQEINDPPTNCPKSNRSIVGLAGRHHCQPK